MNTKIKTVSDFYSSEPLIQETMEMQNVKRGLKIWEKEVTSAYFLKKSSILDIGCGTGREAFHLYDLGYKITGIDIAEYRIKIAENQAAETNRNIEFLLTDGMNLPFEDNTFDIVIIWAQTFGLFYGEENQLHILQECRRVLKKKGILSFSGHDREYLERNYSRLLNGKKFFAYANTDCYWEIFTMDELTNLAQKSGFHVLDCKKGMVYCEEDGTILHCECRK